MSNCSARSHFESSRVARLYPNGEYTVGYVFPKKGEKGSEYDLNPTEHEKEDGFRLPYEQWRSIKQLEDSHRLVTSPNSEQLQRKYGCSGITSAGRRSLRNGAFVLKQLYTNKRLGFYTATLPSVDKEFLKILVENWGDIVHRFFQELRREARRRTGYYYDYIYCVELQEKRSERVGLPIPHIHWVAPAYFLSHREFIFSANKIREIWGRVVSHYIPGTQVYEASIDCRLIQKDVERYIAKYISKRKSKGTGSTYDNDTVSFSCRWWSISRDLGKYCRSLTIHTTGEVAHLLTDISIHGIEDLIFYSYKISINTGENTELVVGYVGGLTPKGMNFINC